MKNTTKAIRAILGGAFLTLSLMSCSKENVEVPDTEDPQEQEVPNPTPSTSIPDALVGTWYAEHNEGPLTVNWEKGTFQGEQGFREFRTMVFTKDGKNAVEYTSEVYNHGDEVKQNIYKLVGTLEYKSNPASITFHPQSGKFRAFSSKYEGYEEITIQTDDLKDYHSVILNPEATTYTSSVNYLNGKRVDGANNYSVKYKKVEGTNPPPGNGDNPGDPLSTPPAKGTYVKIVNQYYPTATIGTQEWTTLNYSGTGGITNSAKPQYGTFYKYSDIKNIPIPEGWRIPTRQDYIKLLKSQGIAYDEVWDSTDGEDVQSKKLLGQLMASSGWLKEDGYANNKSGFNAVPGNLMVTNGNPHGEGSNCLLWTSDKDEDDNPIVFKIIQLPSDTYARLIGTTIGFNPPHIPVRFVKDK